jgi:hypothetical protein
MKPLKCTDCEARQASADGLFDLFNDSLLITPFNNIALAAVYASTPTGVHCVLAPPG